MRLQYIQESNADARFKRRTKKTILLPSTFDELTKSFFVSDIEHFEDKALDTFSVKKC